MVHRGRRSGLYMFVAVHSTTRGPSLGGCRMWGYEDARHALRDALRLSRAMTYKSAVADLPLGGGKGVIMTSPGVTLHAKLRTAALLDFARHGRVAWRPLHHRRGRRHLQPRHAGDRTAHAAGGRAAAPDGRLRRPEPVHRARRGVRHPGLLRAGVRLELAAWTQRGGGRARSRRVADRQALRCAAGARLVVSDIDPRQAPAGRGARGQLGPARARARGRGRRGRALRARRGPRRRDGPTAALPDRRRRGQQPAGRRVGGGSAVRPRDPLGARLRGQRGRDHQHRRGARRVRRPAPPAGGCGGSARSSRRSSIAPTPRAALPWPRRWTWPTRASSPRSHRLKLHIYSYICISGRSTPAGSRPSSASLSRWAASVTVAAARSAVGASLHASSRSSSTLRLPRSSAPRSRRSRSSRCETYWSSLAAGSWTGGPWPGHRTAEAALPQTGQAVEVGDQRSRIGRDEHASLAEHRVARERRRRRGHERQVIRRVTGRGHDLERPERIAFAEHDVHLAAGPRQLRAGVASAHGRDGLGVIGVVVGERDAAQAASPLELGQTEPRRARPAAGPGSTSQAGARPTIHEFVPVSVNGPGLAARTPTMSCSASTTCAIVPA